MKLKEKKIEKKDKKRQVNGIKIKKSKGEIFISKEIREWFLKHSFENISISEEEKVQKIFPW